MLKFLVVVGSTREGRRGRTISDWFIEGARRIGGAEWQLADLADLDLPWYKAATSPGSGELDPHASVQRWGDLVRESDGFVWVTPEYNHGYPASLKNAIDHLYHEWMRKPVSIVSYGGLAGGSRAAEQLRLVACELQMAPIRSGIVIARAGALIGPDGKMNARDLDLAIAHVSEQLIWWGEALKTARSS